MTSLVTFFATVEDEAAEAVTKVERPNPTLRPEKWISVSLPGV